MYTLYYWLQPEKPKYLGERKRERTLKFKTREGALRRIQRLDLKRFDFWLSDNQ